MNITQENINQFLNKYIEIINTLSKEHEYDSNIKHLLYLIIPAFIIKYGVNNENTILDCFKSIKIYISDKKDKRVQAMYNRALKKSVTGYYTDKFVVINNYSEAALPMLIDNIVHEFNHAINSYNNEISYDDKYVRIRTGLSTVNYDKKTLTFINKSDEVSLEEVLNTVQSEEIVNIINSFGKYKIDNVEFSNTLYALKAEINGERFLSQGYQFQRYICEELTKNKTFTPTVNNLRFKGFIEDIPNLFDNVIGTEGSYKRLNKLLTEIDVLAIKYDKAIIFKKRIVNQIRSKSNDVISLIKDYDSKCIFK